MGKNPLILPFSFVFVLLVPNILARVVNDTDLVEYDDYAKQREDHANAAMDAFPHPELFTTNLAEQVEESLQGANSMMGNIMHGECQATNLIDRCWRCKADWADNRQALADCVHGFAQGTTGGKGGEIYEVTCPTDDDLMNPKPGTLRYGATQKKPLWIIFKESMVITLKDVLLISCDKTIDGRGACIEITNGAGLIIQNANNVIIHGIHVHHVAPEDGDGIAVKTSSKVWIDHVTLNNCKDGLLDVTLGSTCVTISNCKFSHHNKVMLLGHDDSHAADENMRVTVAFNKFDEGCVQRMPRVRWGFAHVINNDYNKWGLYAIGGSMKPTIISQGNRFTAPDEDRKKQVTARIDSTEEDWKHWNWRTENDEFLNGAFFKESGDDPNVADKYKEHMFPPEPDVGLVTRDAGALSCSPGKPC